MISPRTLLLLSALLGNLATLSTAVELSGNLERKSGVTYELGLSRRAEDGFVNELVEDDHDEVSDKKSEKPWGEVIIASLLINLASLIGLVFVVGSFTLNKFCAAKTSKEEQRNWKFTHNIIPSFACGALLATCTFLIMPEAIAMLSEFALQDNDAHEEDVVEDEDHDEHDEDVDIPVAWRFGVCVISGFLLPIATSLIFPHYHKPEISENCAGGELVIPETAVSLTPEESIAYVTKTDDETQQEDCDLAGCGCHEQEGDVEEEGEGKIHLFRSLPATLMKAYSHPKPLLLDLLDPELKMEISLGEPQEINWALASSVLIGDFFHNFTDGILVGTAFSLCDRELAVAISAATVYHELAQEIADFFLLTKHCNIKAPLALFLNFVSGLSVFFGAIIILSFDVSTNATGCILAIGSGVYIYIAAAECIPQARKAQETIGDKVISVVSFSFGVIPIGLVLLNHGHCEVH